MKVNELLTPKKHGMVVADGNAHPSVAIAPEEDRESDADEDFDLLDATNPSKPYSKEQIQKAMKELHRRIERQAASYGGDVDHTTGKIDRSKHRFIPAVISTDRK